MKLRPAQERIVERAVEAIWEHGMAYLACETRTGKTFMALFAAQRLGARKVLFLTKRMAISSIKKDFAEGQFTYLIEVLSVDSANKATGRYDLVIVDEAHCIGAYPKPSKRAKMVRQVVGETPVIFLSATPTPESWSQIYHQLWVSAVSPFAEYKNFYAWARDYVHVTVQRIGVLRVNDYSNADKAKILAALPPSFMLTLTQAEAEFQQELTEHVLNVKMHPATHLLIHKLIHERYHRLKDGGEIVCDSPAKLMQKCHQVSGGTVIDEKGESRVLDPSKAIAIRDAFAGKKIVIFYKFVAEFELLKTVFPNWTNSPEEFRASRDKTFLGQFLSAREGLELSSADAVVFYTTDYPWLSYAQAKERIQKKDRHTPAELWFVWSDTGLEQKIYKRLSGKKNYTAQWFMRDWGAA